MGIIARLKGLVGDEEAAEPRYECRDCGQTFETSHQICTSCGGTDIVQLEPA